MANKLGMEIDLMAVMNFVVELMAEVEEVEKPSEEASIHIDTVASVEVVHIAVFASAESIEEEVEVGALAFAEVAVGEEDVDMKEAFVGMKVEFVEASAFVKEDLDEFLMRDIAEALKLHHQLVQRIIQLCMEFHQCQYLQQIQPQVLQISNHKIGLLFDCAQFLEYGKFVQI